MMMKKEIVNWSENFVSNLIESKGTKKPYTSPLNARGSEGNA